MPWAIYYSDGSVVHGNNRNDWRKAPGIGVQVIVRQPREGPVRWHSSTIRPVRDRDLWTGTDTYDPFGWGVKLGELIPDTNYFTLWDRACGD